MVIRLHRTLFSDQKSDFCMFLFRMMSIIINLQKFVLNLLLWEVSIKIWEKEPIEQETILARKQQQSHINTGPYLLIPIQKELIV